VRYAREVLDAALHGAVSVDCARPAKLAETELPEQNSPGVSQRCVRSCPTAPLRGAIRQRVYLYNDALIAFIEKSGR